MPTLDWTGRKAVWIVYDNSGTAPVRTRRRNDMLQLKSYSYKPAKTARTHTANEHFNPDYFVRVRGTHDILVVEIKAEGDDSNRNRAKCRNGLKHFETLNVALADAGEPWKYHFSFLSPEDYSSFFEQVRRKTFAGWKSGLMHALAE
jgi:type III restriction enzyme